jgi:trigger factor
MMVTETLSDGLKRAFTVVVPASDIEGKRTAKLTQLGKTLRLPGFRPGKVPMPVVRQRYGTAVMAEVVEESVTEATRQVLSDRGLRPAVQPKVDLVSLDQEKDLEFKVELELMPEITLPDFSAISLTRLRADVAPEAIDRALTTIATRQTTFEDLEEIRPAATGDTVNVDFVGRIDGTPFPGGAGEGVDVQVGGQGFIAGFAEQIEGMSPGDVRTIDVTFPEDYQSKDLAGKAAQFEITARKLRRETVPAVDDDLAEKIGLENLEKLRDAISQQMKREYDQLSRQRLKRQLLDALAASVSFAVPETMVSGEFDQIWQRLEADRKAGKIDPDDQEKDDDTLKAEYRAIAERRIRLGLLLSEIGRVHTITVGNDEITRAMRTEAARYQGQEAQVMEFFRKNPQAVENLRSPIFEDKVIDFVIELARVEERIVEPDELARDPAGV